MLLFLFQFTFFFIFFLHLGWFYTSFVVDYCAKYMKQNNEHMDYFVLGNELSDIIYDQPETQ